MPKATMTATTTQTILCRRMLPLIMPLSFNLAIVSFLCRHFDKLNVLSFCRSLSLSKGR